MQMHPVHPVQQMNPSRCRLKRGCEVEVRGRARFSSAPTCALARARPALCDCVSECEAVS